MNSSLPTKMLGPLLLVVLVVTGLFSPQHSRAATLTVCGSGCAFTSIQAAINAAKTGDTITVGSGIYRETLVIGRGDFVIQGAGRSLSIIDGGGDGPVVKFIPVHGSITNATVLSGFTIRNGATSTTSGAGIRIEGGASPTIRDNLITGNSLGTGQRGAGIFISGGSPIIEDNTIQGNSGPAGGGIYSANSSAMIRRNEIGSNAATGSGGSGGGLMVAGSAPIRIEQNVIRDNEAKYGGGIAVQNGVSVIVSGNTISENRALRSGDGGDGGGVVVQTSGSGVVFTGNVISGNTADGIAGGVKVFDGSNPEFRQNTVSDNRAMVDGGGFFIELNCSPKLVDNVIERNSADRYAGGLAIIRGSSPELTSNQILNNIAGSDAGGLAIQTCDTGGTGACSTPILRNNRIAGNRATGQAGGGVGGGLKIFGGAEPLLEDNVIEANRAVLDGGGLYIQLDSAPIIRRSLISGNSAGRIGGGLVFVANAAGVVENSLIFDNEAPTGSGIYIAESSPTISHDTIVANRANATDLGHGIYLYIDAAPEIVNTIISHHDVGLSGVASAVPTLVRNLIGKNVSKDYAGVSPGGTDIQTDPKLVSPYAPFDLQTLGASPARDSADPAPALSVDYANAPRPLDGDGDGTARADIGAYEMPLPTDAPFACSDFDDNRQVDTADVMAVVSRWPLTATNPDPDNNPNTPDYEARYDVDGNGVITTWDIMAVATYWGQACP